MNVNERFINDWMTTKETFITHFFPNWEDPSWGHFSEFELAGAVGKFSTLIADKALPTKSSDYEDLTHFLRHYINNHNIMSEIIA